MKMYKTKIGRLLNFIKNENKLKRSDLVEILTNNSSYKKYDKYVGQYAVVTSINFDKKQCQVEVKLLDGSNLGFDYKELRKCNYVEEHTNKDFGTLLKMI